MPLSNRFAAEFFGTLCLILGGCGAIVLGPPSTDLGIGSIRIGLAFGLLYMALAFALGPISGCHLNPAVSLGLAVGGRFSWRDLLPYWLAQVLGALGGAGILFMIAEGKPDFLAGDFACNGYGIYSRDFYAVGSVFLCEAVMTALLVVVFMGSTARKAMAGLAPIAVGACLVLVHLVIIPVSGAGVNPARSTGVAFFSRTGWAFGQLWLFWAAPLVGAVLAGLVFPRLEAQH